ncbi:amino acid ABC transporter permease [Clostridium akagii]|uniref:amino acid ABC transporter permease n=1 Tax=Clostridium akagii TaxID=91623 RepID=UPI000479B4AC|nr:amino acid ABC transporter permease [Clostridium akagii]
MGNQFDINFMVTIALKAAIRYVPITLELALVPFVIGTILGTIIALVRLYNIKYISKILQVIVVIIKGVPVVLQLLIVYFAVLQCFDSVAKTLHLSIRAKNINSVYIGLVALSFFATAYISEAIRGALTAVKKGQYEAGYSVGLTKVQTLRQIILPQAIPVAMPMLCSNLIGLVKGSSLVFMISVTDLLNGALITANSNYKFLEAYVAAAIVYWILCIVIEKISYVLERKFYSFNGR